jgi:hypothetical protein
MQKMTFLIVHHRSSGRDKKYSDWYQFHQLITQAFFYESAFRSFSLVTVWLCNFLPQEYLRKSCSKNVDEIDYTVKQQNQSFPFHAEVNIKF